MEQNLSALENLRGEIEQNHRFKTALNGYDKKDVQNYLAELMPTFEAAMAELRDQCTVLRRENTELRAVLAEKQEALEASKTRERIRAEAEMNARESMVDSLRNSNARLTEDNRNRQVEIADLRQQLDDRAAAIADGSASLDALNRHLAAAMKEKIRECEELMRAWSTEFSGAVAELSR